MASAAPVRGLVLAGGHSRRMGADKAALEIDGATMLARTVAALKQLVPDVYVSVRPDQRADALRSGYQLIEDILSDAGPAAGLLAAHQFATDSAWLVVACDMPLLSVPLLRQLLESRAPESQATAWLSADKSGPEPLCAIYEPDTLAAFLRHVNGGGNPGPRAWLQGRPVKLLEQASPAVLASANTQEDFELLSGQFKAIQSAAKATKNE